MKSHFLRRSLLAVVVVTASYAVPAFADESCNVRYHTKAIRAPGYIQANAINERGHVVGQFDTPAGGSDAFIWTRADGLKDLGTLAAVSSASDINDRDAVVGTNRAGSPTFANSAFLWSRLHGMRDLGNLGGTCDGDTYAAAARAVNIRGRVVGFSSPPDSPDCFHAIVWSRRCGMQDLNDLIDPGSGISVLFEANDINARGQIVANGTDINGVTRAYLLTPEIDEMISALP